MRLSFFPAIFLIGTIAAASDGVSPVLLPIIIEPTPGAHGSLWESEFWIRNGASEDVIVFPVACYTDPCVLTAKVPAGQTIPGPSEVTRLLQPQGVMLYVPRDAYAKMSFQLRVRDISRQALGFGTEIPVVRDNEFRTDEIQLFNIPGDSRFRSTLRIYNPEDSGGEIALRIYRQQRARPLPAPEDVLLVERRMTFPRRIEPQRDHPPFPGIIEINALFSTYPELQGSERIRVEIRPLTPSLRVWAFLSITNNISQEVTTISPQ